MFRNFDWIFFLSSFLILSLGVLAIFSTNPEAAKEQMIFSLIGLFGYFLLSSLDYRLLKQFAYLLYFLGLLSLVAVLIFGTETRGSVRWFRIGELGIQPSEFVKLSLILLLARILSNSREAYVSLQNIIRSGLTTFVLSAAVFIQPDLGTTLSLVFVWVALLVYSGIKRFYLLVSIVSLGVLSFPLWNILKDYQKDRIITFLNPSSDPLGGGYHVIQSIIAVGSGRLLGKGFGSGTQSHLQYLPAYYTDFIFASFAEEWGLIGVIIFLALFFLLLVKILLIAKDAPTLFGNLITLGVFALIFFQFLVSVGMNIGLMPVTGIPLPLFSYGGSSLITTLLALGLVQSIAVHRKS